MNIYFAGSIRGGREDSKIYFEIIKYLKNFGNVFTEHIGCNKLSSIGENTSCDIHIHNRDVNWIKKCDVVIAEVSKPSLGVGYEIGRAIESNKEVLCISKKKSNVKLSAMINGCEKIVSKKYDSLDDVKKKIYLFLKEKY